MQMKKILVIVLASSAILTSTFSSIAAEKTLLEIRLPQSHWL